jgi:hypothetical protein
MRLDTWKSRYEEIKDLTLKIKQYLVRSTVRVLGPVSWQARSGLDLTTVDYDNLPVRVLVDLAFVLTNDPTEAALVSNLFLNRLQKAIELRKYQSAEYAPQTDDDVEYKQKYISHMPFVGQLAAIHQLVLAGTRTHYIPGRLPEPKTSRAKDQSFEGLPVEGWSSESESDRPSSSPGSNRSTRPGSHSKSHRQQTSASAGDFMTDFLSRLGSLFAFKESVTGSWATFLGSTSSSLLPGVSTNIIFHLISNVVNGFVIVEKDLCNSMPVAPYTKCPDTGLGGIIHCMYLTYQKAKDEASDATKPALSQAMYNAAHELFMPAISSYLDHWIRHTQQNAQVLNTREIPMEYGAPMPLPDGSTLEALGEDGTPNLHYVHAWKTWASADMVLECYRLASLDNSNSAAPDCFSASDHLTRTMKASLVDDEISHSAGICIDFMLEARRQLGPDLSRPRQEAVKVAQSALKTLSDFENLAEDLDGELAGARKTAMEILDDRVAQKAKRCHTHPPAPFFLQISNPVLSSVQTFNLSYHPQIGAQRQEQYMPYIRIAITLYKMVRRLLPASVTRKINWPDAGYVLNWNGNELILGQRYNPVNAYGYAYGLLRMIRGEETPDTAVPMTSTLLGIVKSLISEENEKAFDQLVQYLIPPVEETELSKSNSLDSNVDDLRRLTLRDREVEPLVPGAAGEASPPSDRGDWQRSLPSPNSSAPASPRLSKSPQSPSSSKKKHSSRRANPDTSYEFMTQNFDRFQTEFAKEEFHLFFDYPAFWIFCYKVGDMAINCWEHCIGVDNPLSLEADERWQYIEDFMDYAQRGDKEGQ